MIPIANHLWQSTVFAAVTGLLALALRKNHARTRSWLWLIASLKFLVPFSLLVVIGGLLRWPAATPIAAPKLSVVVEQIAQPFPQVPYITAPIAHHNSVLPLLLLTIWITGFLAVALCWWRRWRRIHVAVRAGTPLDLQAAVPVLSSPVLLEPGVFGVFRPILLLPEGIADRLKPAHLEAIIAHELCHVRRRDNLTAAVHMLVEAIFWFHPLVWWIGARLIEERERACDEEVLRLGSAPEVYAESILKTCQFYLESPLVCVSGISGADLKQRIVRIMTQRLTNRLSFSRKLLLTAAGIAAIVGPIVFGLVSASQSRAESQPSPAFEVASIKPDKSATGMSTVGLEPNGRFSGSNITLRFLLRTAYDLKEGQMPGGPSWINSERYDIEAKPDDSVAEEMQKLSNEKRTERLRLMLQSLLADRFKLTLHHDTKELPVYALVVAKNGPKLHEASPMPADPAAPAGRPPTRRMYLGAGQLTAESSPLDQLADALSRAVGRPVLDKTGLNGRYDIKLQWTPDAHDQMFKGARDGPDGKPSTADAPPPDTSGPTIFTALQEQLGLKLESQKAPVDTVVIDHVERPSEN